MKNKLSDKKMKIFINAYLGAVPEQREGGFRWRAGRAGRASGWWVLSAGELDL